jgi:hypothetical protein
MSQILHIDFESYYKSGKEGHSLRTLTYQEYIDSPKFQVIGLGMAWGEGPAVWVPGPQVAEVLANINWHGVIVQAFNALFDCSILHYHYKIHPQDIICTQSLATTAGLRMAKGGSLDAVSEALRDQGYRIETKGKEVIQADGKYYNDFTPEDLAAYGEYCCKDVRISRDILHAVMPLITTEELKFQSMILKAGSEPALVLDKPMLEAELERVMTLQKTTLSKAAEAHGCSELQFRALLQSNPKFAALLEAHGCPVPMKVSAATGKEAPAFAKTDQGLLDLLEHDDINIQVFVAARLGAKSTAEESKLGRMITMADHGPLPMCYNISGAGTHRLSSSQKLNVQALASGRVAGTTNTARRSIMAPEGFVLGSTDSNSIECIAHDSLVLTKARGLIKIQLVSTLDEVWDGQEWVKHDGVVLKGVKAIISYGGLRATADHNVYTSCGRFVSLATAEREALTLLVGERDGQAVWEMAHTSGSPTASNAWVSRSPLRLWPARLGEYGRHKAGQIHTMYYLPQKWAQKIWAHTTSSSEAVARALQWVMRPGKGQQAEQPHLCGDREPLSKLPRFHKLYMGVTAFAGLFGFGDRPQGYAWALREGQYPVSRSRDERANSGYESYGYVQRVYNFGLQVCAGLLSFGASNHSAQVGATGYVARDHDSACNNSEVTMVYDILNAGPRHRFTVSGVVVSNCRVGGYIADDRSMLQIFKNGRDIYSEMAADMYKRNPDEIRAGAKAGDPIAVGQRFKSKAVVLGGIFGSGPAGFQNFAATQMKLKLDFDEAQELIGGFRAKFEALPRMWKICDSVLQAMIRGGSGWFGGENNNLFFYDGSRELFGMAVPGVRLPDGNWLNYLNLRVEKAPQAKEGQYQRDTQVTYDTVLGRNKVPTSIYGSKLFQNGTQALAFAILKQQKIIFDKSFRVVGTTHDEMIYLVPEGQEAEAKRFATECFAWTPEWATGCPLASETTIDKRYS